MPPRDLMLAASIVRNTGRSGNGTGVFTHLRTKLTVLYVALFVAALGMIALTVYVATTRNVQRMVRDQLTASGTVFDNLAATRYRRLEDEAGILARDFGFRAAVATGDRATVRSALTNLGSRLGIKMAFEIGLDGAITAPDGALESALPAPMIAAVLASDGDEASGVFVLNGVAYETVAAPINTPAPAGWVVFASPLGASAMTNLTNLSAIPLKPAVLERSPGGAWIDLSGAHPAPVAPQLQSFIDRSLSAKVGGAEKLGGPVGASIALVRPLPVFDGGRQVVLLLRCAMADAYRPYESLVITIAAIGLGGVLLLVLGSWFLARTLTRPISALEAAARQLQRGETARVTVDTKDEIARLGLVFNAMAGDIQEREESLKRARDIAEAANSAKSTFLANMNHEVRTPLNGVLGTASVLASTPLEPRQKQMVALISSSGEALLGILNDVLDMVELGKGGMTVADEPFDLDASLRDLTDDAAAAAAAKGLAFRVCADLEAFGWVAGDRRRFEQVLSNLLSNAVKFTDAGEVALTVSREADVWRFEVRDTGIGFDPSKIEQMFEPFSQADGSMTRRAGGAGLGLSLARPMARAMGGDLSCTGAPGLGACFTFTLPLPASLGRTEDIDSVAGPADAPAPTDPKEATEATEALDATEPPGPDAQGDAIRVLLADDHPNNRAVVELILGSLGVEIVSVENGAEAVEAFKAQPFDVVLMDLQMPVMDGLTAIREIRAHEMRQGGARTPIVVVSANAQSEHLHDSAQSGADAHLAKPILAPALLAAIDEALTGGESLAAAGL
jgi:signal transduction histidine kinase/CheY-like chemotaxis protein